ncbi:uncharacterized protein LOC143214613 [Lasioglossum baleicum]|uniref:uncharacterized protein LOC143214613 n=1 Tax=Lasioglossum baleicum TaxID=434251 RepID=UPI003FCE30A4
MYLPFPANFLTGKSLLLGDEDSKRFEAERLKGNTYVSTVELSSLGRDCDTPGQGNSGGIPGDTMTGHERQTDLEGLGKVTLSPLYTLERWNIQVPRDICILDIDNMLFKMSDCCSQLLLIVTDEDRQMFVYVRPNRVSTVYLPERQTINRIFNNCAVPKENIEFSQS